MKAKLFVLILLLCLPVVHVSRAQSTPPKPDVPISMKLQVVLTEYDGTKAVSVLPYTLSLSTPEKDNLRPYASVRAGVKVPLSTTDSKGENSINYIDVGTKIDARVLHADEDRYLVELSVERSSLFIRVGDGQGGAVGKEWAPGDPSPSTQPLMHTFQGSVQLIFRDKETKEATVSTDPLTGHVLKIDVTLSIVK